MKLAGARIEQFLRQPDPRIAAVLLFGPDQGLVRERADGLARAIVDDLADPFRAVVLAADAVKTDPARLSDEAAQLSMIGGRQVVLVRDATDGIAAAVESLLQGGEAGNLVIIEAGNLRAGSPLRKLFEKAKNAYLIGCYEDDGRGLQAVIRETLGRHGLSATPDALAFLSANLGGDRLVVRSEIDKLALYASGGGAGNGKPKTVTIEDAQAAVGDSALASLDALLYAVGGGDAAAIDRALERAYAEGVNPVRVLRAVQGHFQRLHIVRAKVEGGEPVEAVLAGLRPPLIFKFKPAFEAQARRWRKDHLATALAVLTEAEIDCKSTGMPAAAICHRALMRIAQAGRAGDRGR